MTLTKKDLSAIRRIVEVTIDETLESKLNEKLKNYPSKEEFFDKMDEVMTELKAIREETTVLPSQVGRNTKRIENIEDKLSLQAS